MSKDIFDIFEQEVSLILMDKWDKPCETMFEYLVENYPAEFIKLIKSNFLKPSDLTFAAEIAGHLKNSEDVRNILLPLLNHSLPIVREGAIYGITNHLDDNSRLILKKMEKRDPSPGVRQALEDMEL